MDFNKEIRIYLIAVKNDILNQINTNDFVASGTMRNKLRVVANQHFLDGEIRGTFYMQYLEKGYRKKPSFVGRNFVANLIDWMRFRNISPKRNGVILPATETNLKRSAFGIAKGIVKKGTPATRQEKNLDIAGAMAKHVQPLMEGITLEFFKTFNDDLKIKPKQS
jgi:hypothetical protein